MTGRKRIEDEVRMREMAIGTGRIGIVVTDPNLPDNPIVYVNPGFERLTGYSSEEVIGRNCRFMQGSDGDQPATEELRAAIREGRECRVVVRNYKKDGELFWNEVSVSPVHDDEGRLANFVAVQNDLTEREVAGDALWRAEEKYRSIFENALEGIFQTTVEGKFLDANPALALMLGYESPEELLASVSDIGDQLYVAPARRADFSRIMRDHGTVAGLEVRLHRKDGSVMWASTSARAMRDAQSELVGYEGTVEDITERKRAEEMLGQQADLLEQTHDAVFMWELGGGVTYWNRGAERLYGWSKEEALGRVSHDLLKTEHPFSFEELDRKLRSDGR